MFKTTNNKNCSDPVFINVDINFATSEYFVAQLMPRRATGQKIEGSATTTDYIFLIVCLITSWSEPVADNVQLGGNEIFNILMPYL